MSEYVITEEQINAATEDILKYIQESSAEKLAVDLELQTEECPPLEETIKLHVSGCGVEPNKISSRLLVNIVNGFQSTTEYIANALSNAPTKAGKIPNDILRQTDFQIVGFFSGSFGVEMKVEFANTLFPEDTLIAQSLNKLFGLLYASDDSDKIVDEIAELGDRALNSYRDLLKTLLDTSVNLEIERRDFDNRRIGWKSESSKLPRIVKILNDVVETSLDEVILCGTLTALNIRKFTFELTNEENGVISGKCSKEAIEYFKDKLGSKVSGVFKQTNTKNVSTGSEKTIWILMGEASDLQD